MPTTAEMIAALPDDAEQLVEQTNDQELQEMYESVSKRRVPVGVLRRLGVLGGLQAKIGLAFTAYTLRGWMQTKEQRENARSEAYLSVALKMLETMSYLRGAVMKVGQLTANLPDVVPEEFVDTLGQLHFQAPSMHFSLIREQVEAELGGELDSLFAEFDTRATAAASLGQVHRARLHSGQQVAVKVQYPGIARSIRSDMRALSAMLIPASIGRRWENMRELIEEVSTMLTLETDYLREADNLRIARKLFTEDDRTIIPGVYGDYTTNRVLTMDWIEGHDFESFLKSNPSQQQRDDVGTLMTRAYSRLYYGRRMLYADPHPGNLLITEDGQLGVIDFGCIRQFNDEEWEYLRLADLCIESGREGVIEHLKRGLMLTDKELANDELMNASIAWCEWIWEPMLKEAPHDYGEPAYFRRGIESFRVMCKYRPMNKPQNLFLLRWQLAGQALLYRLGARVNLHQIVQRERPRAGWSHRTRRG